MNCDFQRERAGNRLSLLRLVLQFYPFSVFACVLSYMRCGFSVEECVCILAVSPYFPCF